MSTQAFAGRDADFSASDQNSVARRAIRASDLRFAEFANDDRTLAELRHAEQEEERCGANQPAFIAECSKGMRLPVIRDRLFGFQGPTAIDRSNPSFGPVRV